MLKPTQFIQIFHSHHGNRISVLSYPFRFVETGHISIQYDSFGILFLYHFLATKDNNLVNSFILYFSKKMDLQQIASKIRLETCCLCHSLRTGCLIILWFWLIVCSLLFLKLTFNDSSSMLIIVVVGILAAIQALGLYAIYKVQIIFLFLGSDFNKNIHLILLSGKTELPMAKNCSNCLEYYLCGLPRL